jgi:hypothetical protein
MALATQDVVGVQKVVRRQKQLVGPTLEEGWRVEGDANVLRHECRAACWRVPEDWQGGTLGKRRRFAMFFLARAVAVVLPWCRGWFASD